MIELIFDCLDQNFNEIVAMKLSIFPTNLILKTFTQLVNYSRCGVSAKTIGYLKENLITDDSQKQMLNQLITEELQIRYKEIEKITQELVIELQKNQIPRLPGEPKRISVKIATLTDRYNKAFDSLTKTEPFVKTISADSDELFLHNIS